MGFSLVLEYYRVDTYQFYFGSGHPPSLAYRYTFQNHQCHHHKMPAFRTDMLMKRKKAIILLGMYFLYKVNQITKLKKRSGIALKPLFHRQKGFSLA